MLFSSRHRILLFTLAVQSSALAGTYTSTGLSGNFTDPALWSGPVPANTATDQLILPQGNLQSPQTITLDSSTAELLNSLTITGAAANQLALDVTNIFTGPGAGLSFTGPEAQITTVSGANLQISVPVAFDSNLTVNNNNGRVYLTGPLATTPTTASLTIAGGFNTFYQNTLSPQFSGGTFLTNPNAISYSATTWTYSAATPAATLSFGTGPITFVDSASFQLAVTSAAAPSTVTLTNAIDVRAQATLSGVDNQAAATIDFAGPVHLAASLFLGPPGPNIHNLDPGTEYSNTVRLSGNITLDFRSVDFLNSLGISTSGNVEVSGNISSDPTDPSYNQQFNLSGNLLISGTDNTYTGGSVITGGGIVTVAPTSSLGTGSIAIQNGGALRITAASLAIDQPIYLEESAILSLATDDRAVLSHLTPYSCGTLSIDTTFTQPLDLSQFHGLTSLSNGTYAAPSLGVGPDHLYRLDADHDDRSGNLNILHGVLVDSAAIPNAAVLGNVTLLAPNTYSGGSTIIASTIVAASQGLGTGNVTIGPQPYGGASVGILTLLVPDAVAPTATIINESTLILAGPAGAISNALLPPLLLANSTLHLGDLTSTNADRYGDNLPLTLNASSLVLQSPTAITEKIGSLSVNGASFLNFTSPSDPALPTLAPQSIERINHGVLFVSSTASDGRIPLLSPQTSGSAGSLIAPWIQVDPAYPFYTDPMWHLTNGNPSFLMAASGAILPATYQAMPTTGGTGTEIVDVPTPQTLAVNSSIAALRIESQLSVSDPHTPVTLRLTSGGLIVTGYHSATIQSTLDFADAEAIVNVVDNSGGGLETAICTGGFIARNGLTKVGNGELQLPANASIAGPITLLQGTLTFAGPLPANSPLILFCGSYLSLPANTTLSSPVTIQPGSSLGAGSVVTIQYPDQSILRLTAPLTGTAGLTFNSNSTLLLAAPVSLTGSQSRFFSPYGPVVIDSTVDIGGDLFAYAGVSGTGYLHAANILHALVNPGDSPDAPGRLTISADSNVTSLDLAFDLFSKGQADELVYQGPPLWLRVCTLTLDIHSPLDPVPYLIFSGLYREHFASITGLPDGFTLSYDTDSISIVPVPEPRCLALLAVALAPALRRRSRPRPGNSPARES